MSISNLAPVSSSNFPVLFSQTSKQNGRKSYNSISILRFLGHTPWESTYWASAISAVVSVALEQDRQNSQASTRVIFGLHFSTICNILFYLSFIGNSSNPFWSRYSWNKDTSWDWDHILSHFSCKFIDILVNISFCFSVCLEGRGSSCLATFLSHCAMI